MSIANDEKLKQLRRIYHTEISKELHVDTLLATLRTLETVLGNIHDHPNEEKYRKIPAANKKFTSTVTDRKGGKSFIVACGFVRKVLEFKEYWTLPAEPENLALVSLALDFIRERIAIETTTHLNDQQKYELEKKKEAERVSIAVQQYEEDRRKFQERREITGGTKASIAQPFRSRDEMGASAPPVEPADPNAAGNVLGENNGDFE